MMLLVIGSNESPEETLYENSKKIVEIRPYEGFYYSHMCSWRETTILRWHAESMKGEQIME